MKQCSPDRLAPLATVLRYKNPELVYKFLESFRLSQAEAEDIFHEMKKWLWLCAKNCQLSMEDPQREAPELFFHQPILLIDEMWHCFLLFSAEYAAFCERYFGFLVMHQPIVRAAKLKALRSFHENRERFFEAEASRYRHMYTFICEQLGEATLEKWFGAYRDRYTREFLLKAVIPFPSLEFVSRGEYHQGTSHLP